MNRRDLTLALLVVTIWGANFTVIKLGLDSIPPMLLVALRYTFAALPAILFVKRPAIGWRYIVVYGMTVGVGQFACLFYAMNIGMPASIASVILQSQAYFTFLFAAIFLKESIKPSQMVGLVLAGFGLWFIGGNVGSERAAPSIPFGPFLLTLLGAAFWGLSNIVVRYVDKQSVSHGQKLDMLSLVVWSSLIPPLPLFAFAILLDTPKTLLYAIVNLNAISVFAVLYLAFCATLFGFYTWSTLLAKYPAGKVAQMSLLVPIAGLVTAQIVLGEQLSKMQWLGCMIIFIGLVTSNFGGILIHRVFNSFESNKFF
ncbi:EamA family transporter [Desulfallas thermosapovorans]|uniref:O-acetylserine/cysteine efflux transporter n=1 Tax=Desulfallas thermosapovorans DSM 6562 TaxID=1121431 RepID=A0A5S4ZPM4_9FIRM|nr:EamA family transporter [Desulfallas thermosapovorans]TYO92322.1 O-acetylserine/cysteine efflux transporter [Desulfallas thermosapovorans DSM 6562]